MVDAAARIALQEFRHRRIRPRRLHQLDLGAAEIDIGEPHALLLVDFRSPATSPYFSCSACAAASMSGTTIDTWQTRIAWPPPISPCQRAARRSPARPCQAPAQDLVGVLAEHRRRASHRARRVAELERNAEHLQCADKRMLDRLDHLPRCGVRVVERLRDRIDAAARNACRLQLFEPGVRCVAGKCLVRSCRRRTSRLATRSRFDAKRASFAHSGWPSSAANRANCASLPTATAIIASAAG